MPTNQRVSTTLIALLLVPSLLAACAQTDLPATQTTVVPIAVVPTLAPTVAPTTAPTEVIPTATATAWTFPPSSTIAGADVGGLTEEDATAKVAAWLETQDRRIALRAPRFVTSLRVSDYVQVPDAAKLVADARAAVKGDAPVEQPLGATVDNAALRAFVLTLAPKFEQPLATQVISDAKALTQTFTFAETPAETLNVDLAVAALTTAIEEPTAASVTLPISTTKAARPPMEELDRVLREHAAFWDGVAAFYVQDLQTGETVAYNADTVFSGASVMKVPIMIFVYSRLGALDEQQKGWLEKVVIDSENLEANALLAAAVGGEGTEAALEGVNQMSEMLKSLGLEHTYQLIPYESGEWLIQNSLLPQGGPAREGEPPYTTPDGYVRTTPREMGTVFVMLDECTQGKGALLEIPDSKLTPDLCREMVAWLERPHDQERMVAGLPAGTKVAHKGGWIDDMQSDVGIVDSPGGRYVAAIYVWTDGYVTNVYATPSPYLGDFSHTIYTFFNPVPLDEVPQPAATAEPE